jgi:hypothetical protein
VRAFGIELLGVLGVFLVLDLEQLAGVIEGPAMKRTGKTAFIAMLAAAQHGAPVGTGIDKGIQAAVFAACQKHGLAANIGSEVIIHIGQLAFMRQVNPIAFKNMLHLQLEQIRIREDVTTAAIHACFLVFFQGSIKQVPDIVGFIHKD